MTAKQYCRLSSGVERMCRLLGALMLPLMLLGLSAMNAGAAVLMEDIQFSSLPGDKVEIRMTFDGEPPVPSGYTIEQPARIALDLMDTRSGLSDKYHSLGSGNARSITVVEADDRTRVIVSLTDLVGYNTTVQGNTLYVLVGDDVASDHIERTGESYATDDVDGDDDNYVMADSSPFIEDIDFRRGDLGEGQIIVTLSDPGIGVDVSTEGGNIRVLFNQTVVPERLQRRLDVRDFATPVQIVDALPDANDTVITVEPNNEIDYEYLAYQADEIFTLEVKPVGGLGEDRNAASQFLFKGEKLSLNFQDIEIRSVLQLIADFTDLNLVASDTVAGRITLRLKNVPWDQALEIIMKAKGLDKRQVGNVLMVAPAAELAAREELELESREKMSELAPLRTEFIEVKYAKATELYELFRTSAEDGANGQGFLSPRGRVIVDERTNSIILTETIDKINDLRDIMEKLDVPVRQVLIEARIVTVNESFQRRIGVKWGVAGGDTFSDGATQFGGNLGTVNAIRDSQINGTPLQIDPAENLVVDLGAGGTNSFALGFVNADILLDAEIDLAEIEGNSETIARPKLITSDKTQASVQSGFQIPYQEAASSGATATSFVDATLGLDVTPQITPDDRLILDIVVTNNRPGPSPAGGGPPPIETNSITTQVLVDNNTTVVLGGIYQTQVEDSVSKVPFFGDLPVVGSLFRNNAINETKSELLIFITPRLLEDQRR